MKNMSLPLVSVVMPVYNGEKYLIQAIDSVLNQSYRNIELVIVNDGSTDSSKKIITAYSDSRIRFVENEINSGIVYSRNKGLESANGEYVATLDCDDLALPERIEKQVDFMEKNPEYGMCGTFYIAIDGMDIPGGKKHFPTDFQNIATHLVLGNCFCNSTVMIRSHIAKELKYREKFDIVEDYELWYRISKRAKLANLPFYGTLYRVHGTNISVTKLNVMLALVKKINGEILRDLKIEFSEKELEIHANLLNRNIDYFRDDRQFSELETWVAKLYGKLKKEDSLNSSLLFELLAEKWLVIVFNTKRYKKLFFNRLFPLRKGSYLMSLYRRVYIKISKTEPS